MLRVVERELVARDERRPYPELSRLLIAATAERESSLKGWARQRLLGWVEGAGWKTHRSMRSFGNADEIAEAQVIVWALQQGTEAKDACANRLLELCDSTWDVLDELGPVLNRAYWGKRWNELLAVLLVGGHRRDPNSWQYARLTLLANVALAAKEGESLPMELEFLVRAAADAVGNGDATVANRAVYSLVAVSPHIASGAEQLLVDAALRAAADDIRVEVAHGAAFAAGYLGARALRENVPSRLRECADDLRDLLDKDPSAVVQRQLAFGRAKGRARFAHPSAVD